ncbi:MAG: glycosyltransferase family 2 protein, partial [Candidatus Magasanikbacteria bacterium]|nr:glycosyltransferase family 2 protein [Candidatus Magasanikbacteria bacterium]
KINILIPMAGNGSRFQKKGYTLPKPMIDVAGKPIIQRMLESLNIIGDYIFIVRKEHVERHNLDSLLKTLTPGCKILPIDMVTEGAACTTLLAKMLINNNIPLLIADCDLYIEWDSEKFLDLVSNMRKDACVLTFTANNEGYSYVRTDETDTVVEAAEKKVISTMATCGVHFWQRGEDYVKYAEQMIAKNIRTKNEFYVCPVYNEAILDNKKIAVFPVEKWLSLGTPEELEFFIKNKIDSRGEDGNVKKRLKKRARSIKK